MAVKVKNHLVHLKMTQEMKGNISSIAEALEMTEQSAIRLLLNNAIHRIKVDSIRAGGFSNLEFTIKEE